MLTAHDPGEPRRSRVPLAAAAVATVILVPFIVADLTGGDDENPPPEAAAAPATSAQPATGDESEPAEPTGPRTITLNPDWPAKGTSVFGESETETKARIESREATTATPELPATSGPTTTRPVQPDEPAPAPAPTAPAPTASPTAPPPRPTPTAAPPTPAPTTAAPTTAAPTTTAAPPDPPPAVEADG